jgi:osmotically-inducible protein OsmY
MPSISNSSAMPTSEAMHTSSTPVRRRQSLVATLLVGALAIASLSSLQGCIALVGAGAVAGGLSLNDRRTGGSQLEDQSIELKAGPRIREAIGDNGHVSVTSYNRIALITGEVPTDADKAAAEKAVAGIEGVASVVNELEVGPNSTLSTRSSDTLITTRVKSALIDAKDVQASAIKVVTERGNVYLMGRVTEREAARASDIARAQASVLKVVRVFEILTEEQLANLR